MKKISFFLIAALLLPFCVLISGCSSRADRFGYGKLFSDTLSMITYFSESGEEFTIARGYYAYDDIIPHINERFEGLKLKRVEKGAFDDCESLTFFDAKGSSTVSFSGSYIAKGGILYKANKDLGGLQNIFIQYTADTATAFFNESYGGERHQRLDVFLPEGEGTFPFALLIHGGGSTAGSKENFYASSVDLTSRGYAAVTIDYRMTGDGAKIPDMLDDIGAALAFLKENSARYRLKTDHCALIGGSAGAHLALLYGYKIENPPIGIAFIVSMAGSVDFTNADYLSTEIDLVPLLNAATGDTYRFQGTAPASWTDASPVTYIKSGLPYTIIAHGTKDEIVPYSEAVLLHNRLDTAGVPNTFITYQNGGHGLTGDIDAAAAFQTAYYAAFENYLQ